MAALAWLVFFGPDGCDFLGSIRHRELSAEMLPWIKENLDAAWLNDNPDPQSIVVENVKILKSSATSEKNIENAQVSIKGYYLTPQSEQRVKFKIQKQIIVEQTETPTPSAFGLVTIQTGSFQEQRAVLQIL
jgi:hypothetical protein